MAAFKLDYSNSAYIACHSCKLPLIKVNTKYFSMGGTKNPYRIRNEVYVRGWLSLVGHKLT
jgi:hypothetical protein